MLHALLHNPYPIIAFFSVIEGPLIAIASGVGYALIKLNPFFAFAIIMAGAFIQDLIYYWLGRWAASVKRVRDFATHTKLLRENFLTVEVSWRRDMVLTLVLSKFAYGLYAPFVVSAGSANVPFLKFLGASMAISAPVVAMWMGVGYGFAQLYGATGHSATYAVAGVGVVALVVLFFAMRRARSHINPNQARRKSNLIEGDGEKAKPAG
ncbi:MAG: DedA family protein [Caulobacteraceae bacterium]